MDITNFTMMVQNNLNDPNCALSVGAVLGSIFLVKLVGYIVGGYIVLKIVERLALDPILEWLKAKIWRRSK